MSKSAKQIEKENARKQKILDVAYKIFVEKSIEATTMQEIATAAGVGRATLFRCYASKLELVIAVCIAQWKSFIDNLDASRPISSIGNISAIDRFTFTLDGYIGLYMHRKDLLRYNDNFNHYVTHEGASSEQLADFYRSLTSMDTRFHLMYEKAKEDKTFRTDIPEGEFFRVTLHSMLSLCMHYAGGFVWGSDDSDDYTKELLRHREMILNYVKIPM